MSRISKCDAAICQNGQAEAAPADENLKRGQDIDCGSFVAKWSTKKKTRWRDILESSHIVITPSVTTASPGGGNKSSRV